MRRALHFPRAASGHTPAMRLSLALFSLSALLGFAAPALAGGGAPATRLQPTPCVYDLPSGFQEGRNASSELWHRNAGVLWP